MDHTWEIVKKHTPDYMHMTHYDDDEYLYISDILPLCEKGAFRADLIRLEVLYRYGGIYLDSDIELYSGLDDFLDNDLFVCLEDDAKIINAVIGSSKENEHILNLLKLSKEIILSGKLKKPYIFKLKPLGQFAFGPYVFAKYLTGKENITILDSNVFGTYWDEKNKKGTYGSHLCAGSWLDK